MILVRYFDSLIQVQELECSIATLKYVAVFKA